MYSDLVEVWLLDFGVVGTRSSGALGPKATFRRQVGPLQAHDAGLPGGSHQRQRHLQPQAQLDRATQPESSRIGKPPGIADQDQGEYSSGMQWASSSGSLASWGFPIILNPSESSGFQCNCS